MPAPSLPTELWNMIGQQDGITQNDLCSFVQVNHSFLDIFTPLLYANIHIRAPDWQFWNQISSSSVPFEYAGALVRPLLEKLEGSQRFRDYVRTCRLGYKRNRPFNAHFNRKYESLVESIMLLLIKLPKINLVHLENFECKSDWIKWLASTPSLRTITTDGISINETTEANQEHQDDTTSFTLESFYATTHNFSWNSLLPVILCKSLRHLHLPDVGMDVLLPAHGKCGSPVFTLLVSLQLSFLERETGTFLRYTPNLIELNFQNRFKTQNPIPTYDWIHVVPKLEKFEGCSRDIPLFTAGRSITTLLIMDSFWDYQPMSIIAMLPKQFGSTTNMRTLEWKSCENPGYLLDYLVHNAEQLEELIIDQYDVRQIKKDEVDTWLPKIEKLKKLRRLVLECSFGPSNSSVVTWEKERCELLQTRSCLDIVSISLRRGVVWTRHPDDASWKITNFGDEVLYILDTF